MAVGHAKYTGRVGLVTSTQGPGAVHLVNGLYDAKLNGRKHAHGPGRGRGRPRRVAAAGYLHFAGRRKVGASPAGFLWPFAGNRVVLARGVSKNEYMSQKDEWRLRVLHERCPPYGETTLRPGAGRTATREGIP